MRLKNILILFFVITASQKLVAQKGGVGAFKGINLECNTAVVIYNIKISPEFEYYKNDFLLISLQPGFEFIHAFSVDKTFYNNSPYYDINVLGSFHLFYDSDISFKPFIGLAYRITSSEINKESYFEPKYGLAIQFNLSNRFDICLKAMNVSTRGKEGIPMLFGIGFNVIIF